MQSLLLQTRNNNSFFFFFRTLRSFIIIWIEKINEVQNERNIQQARQRLSWGKNQPLSVSPEAFHSKPIPYQPETNHTTISQQSISKTIKTQNTKFKKLTSSETAKNPNFNKKSSSTVHFQNLEKYTIVNSKSLKIYYNYSTIHFRKLQNSQFQIRKA